MATACSTPPEGRARWARACDCKSTSIAPERARLALLSRGLKEDMPSESIILADVMRQLTRLARYERRAMPAASLRRGPSTRRCVRSGNFGITSPIQSSKINGTSPLRTLLAPRPSETD